MPDSVSRPRLTAAERRVVKLLAAGYRRDRYDGSREVALIPPGVTQSWDSAKTVWVRQRTIDSLARKQKAASDV